MSNEQWAVDPQAGIVPLRDTSYQPTNKALRMAATLFSWVFHPLFVPVYIACFLVYLVPQLFAGFTPLNKIIVIIRFVVTYTMFPLVTVLLLKALGFIQSVRLMTQKDRIIPYISTNIFYFWMAYVLRNQGEFAHEVVQLAIAIFIASSIGLLMNIWLKISMHAISMGILVVFLAILAQLSTHFTLYLSGGLLLAGLVCTSRMIVSDHTPREIYAGLLVGALSMLLAVWVDGIIP